MNKRINWQMFKHFETLPNRLTGFRLALIPVMWVLALTNQAFWVGVGLALSFVSDALDGAMARRMGQVTEFGAKIDSLADNLLMPSAIVWIVILHSEILAADLPVFLAFVISYEFAILFGLVKFRRFGNLHLYSSKAAGALLYVFAIHMLLVGVYNQVLFFLAAGMAFLASTERLAVLATRSYVNENIGSIFRNRFEQFSFYAVLRGQRSQS